MTLTVIENSALNPTVTRTKIFENSVTKFPANGNVTTPQSFALAVGGTLSSTATRTNVLHLFYRVVIFAKLSSKRFVGQLRALHIADHCGNVVCEDNFKIYQWLKSTLFLQYTQVANYNDSSIGQQGQNGVSTEIKFEIVSNGNISPAWKIVNVANSGPLPLFSTGRDRTQDIIITIGPLQQPSGGSPQLSTTALELSFRSTAGGIERLCCQRSVNKR